MRKMLKNGLKARESHRSDSLINRTRKCFTGCISMPRRINNMGSISLLRISTRPSHITPKTAPSVRKVNRSLNNTLKPFTTKVKQKETFWITRLKIKLYLSVLSRFAVKCILTMANVETMLKMVQVRWLCSQGWNTKAITRTTGSTVKDGFITLMVKFAQTKHGITESLSWRRRNSPLTKSLQTS